MRNSRRLPSVLAALAAAGAAALATRGALEAHKPITSKYTYNADIFPIVRDRCAACHFAGGPAPMSLLAYKDALPWAESIRQELIAERMPPWFADPAGPAIRESRWMSASEVDTLLTWATGGTPEGDPSKRPFPIQMPHGWTAGSPDAVLLPDAPYTVPADVQDETRDFTIATSFAERRWIRGADLLPGDPTMVRDAVLSVAGGAIVLAWVPGERAVMAPEGAAFGLPAGAQLTLHVHYRKSWQDERVAKTDRSKVGLYFAAVPGSTREIGSLDAGQTVDRPVSVVSVRPVIDKPYGSLEVRAATAGSAIVLLRLRSPRPGWPRRYWLERPIPLPAGSRIEIATTAPMPAPEHTVEPAVDALRVGVDVVGR